MSQSQFHALARQILAHEQSAPDTVRAIYWGKHFTRLVSMVRFHNTFGAN
jgi:hypothetical protein